MGVAMVTEKPVNHRPASVSGSGRFRMLWVPGVAQHHSDEDEGFNEDEGRPPGIVIFTVRVSSRWRCGSASGFGPKGVLGSGSGLLGARGQNHRGGESVHAQRRDVDLVAAVGRKLQRNRDGSEPEPDFWRERVRTRHARLL